MSETRSLTPEAPAERLDKYLASAIPEISRTKARWLIEEGYVRAGESICRDPSAKTTPGKPLTVTLPTAPLTEVKAVAMDLDILFEDAAMLVINKPAGLTVHPAAGHRDDTLVNALLAHCGNELSAIGGEARPGIVHRLDKDTSGLMVVAKSDTAHQRLAAQLSDRSLSRTYQALVWGSAPRQGRLETQMGRHPIHRQKMAVLEQGGKTAITHYTLLEKYQDGKLSLVQCKLETGRTHQIRVHMTHLGHPLVGDQTYGGGPSKQRLVNLPDGLADALKSFPRQALHATAIGFIHPLSGEAMAFSAPLPEDMAELVAQLKGPFS